MARIRTATAAAGSKTEGFIGFPRTFVPEEYRTTRRADLSRGRLLQRLSTQCFRKLFEELGELAGHDREVDVELLGGVDVLAAFPLGPHLEKFHALHVQLVGEHEGDAIAPGEAQSHGVLARLEVTLNFTRVQRVTRPAHG